MFIIFCTNYINQKIIITGICSFDGLIYVCGGYDGASCLSSLERYDPLTGVWSSCPAMSTRRRYCRIAVVGMFHRWYVGDLDIVVIIIAIMWNINRRMLLNE